MNKFTDLTFGNSEEALISGLVLAVTAPTDEGSAEALRLTESLAQGMSKDAVERSKAAAAKIVDGWKAWA